MKKIKLVLLIVLFGFVSIMASSVGKKDNQIDKLKIESAFAQHISKYYPGIKIASSEINPETFIVYDEKKEAVNFIMQYDAAKSYLENLAISEDTGQIPDSINTRLCTLAYGSLFYDKINEEIQKIVSTDHAYKCSILISNNELFPEDYTNEDLLIEELQRLEKPFIIYIYMVFDNQDSSICELDISSIQKIVLNELDKEFGTLGISEYRFFIYSSIIDGFSNLESNHIIQAFLERESLGDTIFRDSFPEGLKH